MAHNICTFAVVMKKMLAYLLLSTVPAVALSICTEISIPDNVLSTLYTVAGVIFSVGMSLTISPKTDAVTVDSMRKKIRASFIRIRDLFIWFFILDTILFIMAEGGFFPKITNFFNISCGIFLFFSVSYYIVNFISLQKLGEQIEDQIQKEKTNLS